MELEFLLLQFPGKLANQENFRSSRPEVSCKKDALKNLAKFTGKNLCTALFL